MDERFNGGGTNTDYILDYLRRPLMNYRTTRDGEDTTTHRQPDSWAEGDDHQ